MKKTVENRPLYMDGLILTKISSLYINAKTESNPDKVIDKMSAKTKNNSRNSKDVAAFRHMKH